MQLKTILNHVERHKSFDYAMRRVECRTCGVKVELVPWCEGKHQLTTTYR